ncbi:MAG: 30S ribosomal protein S20 [Candidatus Eremiobacteraeota bacterium]|nr:30S ribosomal protein S20 [Candidatus Eremiobacteraeota bacterium]
MKKGASAKKRARQNIKRRARNDVMRSLIKRTFKHANRAIEEGKPDIREKVLEAFKAVDKAAQKGTIHRNKAARKKSRLMKKFNRLEKKSEG